MSAEDEADFKEFATVALGALRPLAHAVARDGHRADDLVQGTLEKMYAAWPRIARTTASPMAYARTVLVRTLISEQRRPWWSRELSVGGGAELDDAHRGERSPPGRDAHDALDTRQDLLRALALLAPRQRLAVVLRHLEDLSVEEVARLMQISPGAVKSTTSAGISALRQHLAHPVAQGADR